MYIALSQWQYEIFKAYVPPDVDIIISENSKMYTEQEANEMARGVMWRRLGVGKYGRSKYCKCYGRPNPTEEDYVIAEDKLDKMYAKRTFYPSITISPFEKEDMSITVIPPACASTTANYAVVDCLETLFATYTSPKMAKKKAVSYSNEKEEKENTMNDYRNSEAATQRTHLIRRLEQTQYKKREDLQNAFNMHAPVLKTKEDVEKAMKDGLFRLHEAYADGTDLKYGFCTSMLQVVNPKRDEAGYNAAEALMNKAAVAARDEILVLPVEKGLEALNKFEASTFH